MSRRFTALAIWLIAVALGALVLARARFSADLSAFLPSTPSASQRLLIDQLQNGLAAHLVLIGIDGGDARQRAQAARDMTAALAAQAAFVSVEDGAEEARERDRAFVFAHRYLLSPAVTAASFEPSGLHSALENSLDWLTSPAGLIGKSLLTTDPTGETLRIVDALDDGSDPHREEGVWTSPDGSRALLLAEVRAAGSDTDEQARAIGLIRKAFADAAASGRGLHLLLSGPAVFAVEARATIEHEVKRVTFLSSAFIVSLLLLVYRSLALLLLGLLPVVSGALAGIAAVSLLSGVVHGITLGFGTTLIGESVDYSIYLFVQSRRDAATGTVRVPHQLWSIIGLGMLTSVCGFATLLPSSFPGLQQLGIYSIAGLLAAAAVTRGLLPAMLPVSTRPVDLAPLGARAAVLRAALPVPAILVAMLSVSAAAELYAHRAALWNRDLAALSPVAASAQALDGELRHQLGAPDISNLVIVDGPDMETVLERAEATGAALDALIARGRLGGYDSPARYLPSARMQQARRASLPDPAVLRQRLRSALSDLPIRPEALEPFITAVDTARRAPDIDRAALAGTSLGLASDALLWQKDGRWHGLLPLRASQAAAAGDIDVDEVRAALAGLPSGAVHALNLKHETDALYGSYLHEAIGLSLWGLGAILLLLAVTLHSPVRIARVMAPLIASVLVVSAGLLASGTRLTILHLIGLLLIVAVGSNYALFFDARATRRDGLLPSTLASLLIANATTVIGFGVLALSRVPVLQALGATVAPGALLALWFAAALTPRKAFVLEAAP
jgi:predicted exporter